MLTLVAGQKKLPFDPLNSSLTVQYRRYLESLVQPMITIWDVIIALAMEM